VKRQRHPAPSFAIEESYRRSGQLLIAGVDEAGRGALAGPLAVGLVIYDGSLFAAQPPELSCVRDSKCLSPAQRRQAYAVIQRRALVALHAFIPHSYIDCYSITIATELALLRLLARSPLRPDLVLMDGCISFSVGVPCRAVVHGDARSISIASASIVAKVARDGAIERCHDHFPRYGFKRNKGYGTAEHRQALARIGPCPIHRRSYEPLKGILAASDRSPEP
jgi:ribonuclease HII